MATSFVGPILTCVVLIVVSEVLYLIYKRYNIAREKCTICVNTIGCCSKYTKTRCGHYFHKTCFEEWKKINITCPNCRSIAISNEELERIIQNPMIGDVV